jgi:2-methylcitrate dehydratase PrpD
MVREHNLKPEQITGVEVRLPNRGGEEPARHELNSPIAAWHDLAYNVAVAIFDVHPWRAWQEASTYTRPDVLALRAKVRFGSIRDDENMPKGNYWEGWAPARITIEANGRTYEGANDSLRRLSDDEVRDKYRENVSGLLPQADAAALEQACLDLMDLRSARDLTRHFPTTLPPLARA